MCGYILDLMIGSRYIIQSGHRPNSRAMFRNSSKSVTVSITLGLRAHFLQRLYLLTHSGGLAVNSDSEPRQKQGGFMVTLLPGKRR